MIRKVFSLLLVAFSVSTVAIAQNKVVEPCATTEVSNQFKQAFPEIEKYENQLRTHIKEQMKSLKLNRASAKGTFGPNDTLHIPVVIHIVHDYESGDDYISDKQIYALMDDINETFLMQNTADLANVITPWKPYVGNPKIMFHLAQKDPLGNATTGITRTQSYLSDGGDDQAKLGQWDPSSYLNIWFIKRIGRGASGGGTVLAYATPPASAAAFPYGDGIIGAAEHIDTRKTIPHEIGHILNLIHPWGNVAVSTDCTGDDEVDDTTPTTGHFGNGNPYGATAAATCNNTTLYDTSCTRVKVSLSKILLDTSLTPQVENTDGIGFDYTPKTNVSIDSIAIYPNAIGDEFTITNYIGNTVVNQHTTQRPKVAKTSLGSKNASASTTGANNRSTITFDVQKYMWLDSVEIYPNSIGNNFSIQLLKLNNDTIKTINGTTTTNSGKQVVAISAFLEPASGYKLRIVQNPGLKCDSLTQADLTTGWDNPESGVLSFVNNIDTTNQDAGTTPGAYKGRYVYFYNWHIRHNALTITDSGKQDVRLNFATTANTTYSLKLSKNPGVYNDLTGAAPYVKSVTCILDISNETSNGRYNGLYDLVISHGYVKNCIDYPDTVNTQNIMDYSYCPLMFTELQVERMRASLSSNVGGRSNLVKDTTHVRTGILSSLGGSYKPNNDMKPIPDFSVELSNGFAGRMRTYYMCGSETFKFQNRSWRDTVTSSTWTFSNGATNNNVSQSQFQIEGYSDVTTSFTEYGWVDITLTATGNNTGDSTETRKAVVYAADPDFKINPLNGFFMEFQKDDNSAYNDLNKWPIFNYYNNDYQWKVVDNVGYYDKSCIKFTGYDTRVFPKSYTGTPLGDFDDFFTPAFDLSGMTSTDCRLNFLSAGAFRTTDPDLMLDTLEIAYSTNCGRSWVVMGTLSKNDIASKGTVVVPFEPLWQGDWKLNSIDVPAPARANGVFFRFRYRPGADNINAGAGSIIPGTGNNFYLDRINVSAFPLGLNTLIQDGKNISLAPNPTTGSAQLVIKSNSTDVAKIQVTDVTGKVVYSIQHELNGNINNVEIPASAIKTKGVYLVHVLAGGDKFTEKLVSY